MNLISVMKSIPWKNWLICWPKVCLNKKYFKIFEVFLKDYDDFQRNLTKMLRGF